MVAIADARPVTVVDIGLSAGPFDALSSVVWTTLPNRILRWSMTRGRQHELSGNVPARGSMVWDNRNRDLDPTNTTGPYAAAGVTKLLPMRRIRRRCLWGTARTITGATNATPIVVTSNAHGLANGDLVDQSGVGGNTAANGLFKIAGVTANTYQLTNVYTGASVAGSGAYTSGGVASPFFWSFHGYAVDFPTSWEGWNSATTTVELVDVFALFQRIPIPASPWEFVVRRDKPRWWFKPTSGALAIDQSGGNRSGTYQGAVSITPGVIPGYDGGSLFRSDLTAQGVRASFPHKDIITGYPFTVEAAFIAQPAAGATKTIFFASDGASINSQRLWFFVSATTGTLKVAMRDVSLVDTGLDTTIRVDDGLPHTVAWVATSASTHALYIDGIDRTVVDSIGAAFPTDLSAGFAVGNTSATNYGDFPFARVAGDSLGDVVVFDSALALERIVFHDVAVTLGGWAGMKSSTRVNYLMNEISWPAADMDVAVGGSTMPGGLVAGSLLANFQAIERAEAGSVYVGRDGKITLRNRYYPLTSPGNVSQWAFGEASTEVGYDPPAQFGGMESELFTRAEGNRVGGAKQVTINAAAETAYGIRALTFSDLQLETDAEVKDYLDYQLGRYDAPRVRVRQAAVKPQEDPTVVWPKVLGHDHGATVTFKAQPPGGGPLFNQPSVIEQIAETWTPVDVTYVYGLSAADTSSYWVLGTSLLGAGTVLGF